MLSGNTNNPLEAARLLEAISNVQAHPDTVRRVLKRHGLWADIKVKRPKLSTYHRQQRLAFAREHKKWTLEDWKWVVWSDETKINLYGTNGREYVWKKQGMRLLEHDMLETEKHGDGSIMLWGCMTWEGVGRCYRIEGIMNSGFYITILQDELLGTIKYMKMNVKKTIFQQDNDPKHTSKKT